MMRHSLKAMAAIALIGAGLALPAASPSAARTATPRHYQNPYGEAAIPRYGARNVRCGGRRYTYLGGWGCDYYRYTYDWPLGHR
jgi:hypothetical protein